MCLGARLGLLEAFGENPLGRSRLLPVSRAARLEVASEDEARRGLIEPNVMIAKSACHEDVEYNVIIEIAERDSGGVTPCTVQDGLAALRADSPESYGRST